MILTPCGVLAEKSGLYHLTASGETSWRGFAGMIVAWLRATGRPVGCRQVIPISTVDYPTPAKRPACSLLDRTKLREAFGIVMPDWREQLRLCVDI